MNADLANPPTDEDIAWARKHGWTWYDSYGDSGFVPTPLVGLMDPFIRVIPNPMAHNAPGWVPWLQAIGALQMDAPFGNARAALRVAESIRRQRRLTDGEMSCAERVSPLELLAMTAE